MCAHSVVLVAAMVQMRISASRAVPSAMQRKLDVKKLRSQLSDKLRQPQSSPNGIGVLWANIFHSLRDSAEAVVGFERSPKRNHWQDKDCRAASAAKNDVSKRTVQSAATRAILEDFRQKRREEKSLIRRKKRQQEWREREEIEMYRSRNEAQKFFKNVQRLREGFKPGASSCRDKRGNMITDAYWY